MCCDPDQSPAATSMHTVSSHALSSPTPTRTPVPQDTHLDIAAVAILRLKRPSIAMCPTPNSSSRNVADATSSQQSMNLQGQQHATARSSIASSIHYQHVGSIHQCTYTGTDSCLAPPSSTTTACRHVPTYPHKVAHTTQKHTAKYVRPTFSIFQTQLTLLASKHPLTAVSWPCCCCCCCRLLLLPLHLPPAALLGGLGVRRGTICRSQQQQ
jgi:hypothetical protein